jgi:pimeloyl-ACP methyl ester carboxylesterase
VPVSPEIDLAYDRAGPTTGSAGRTPILLLHAGIADRRMWNPIWPALTASYDVLRVDLRGFGESTARPAGPWSPRADVLRTLDALGVERAHAVGCSFGAGVAVEIALERPSAVASLVLAAPGGALLTERTDELVAFFEAEGSALEAGDLDAAVEANLAAWVDGPHRGPDEVSPAVRDAVRTMQRQAFELTADWPDAIWEEDEQALDPEAPERLDEIAVPTLVISGELDIDSIRMAADHLLAGVRGARGVVWPDVAHVPSMERPDDFAAEVLDWVARAEE